MVAPFLPAEAVPAEAVYRTDAIPEALPVATPPKTKKKKKHQQKHIPTAVVMDGWTYPAEGGGFINRDYSQDRCRNCNQSMRVPLDGGLVHYVCPRCGFENKGKPRPISGQCCPFR